MSEIDRGNIVNTAFETLNKVMSSFKFRHYGLGWINRRRIKRIVPIFDNYVSKNPDDEQARYAFGKSLQLLDRHDKALTHFQPLSNSQPENLEYQLELATEQIHLNQYVEAKTTLDHVKQHVGDDADILQRYAGLMIVLDNDDAAKEALSEAQEIDPNNKHLQTLSQILTRLENDEIYRPDLPEIINAWRVTNYLSDNAKVTLGMGEK